MPGTWPDGDVVCRHLRAKGYYMRLAFHPSGYESEGTPCWCFRTQQIFGPDGGWATREGCRAGRDCFEPTAKSEGHGEDTQSEGGA